MIHNGGLTLLKELKQFPGFKLSTSGPPISKPQLWGEIRQSKHHQSVRHSASEAGSSKYVVLKKYRSRLGSGIISDHIYDNCYKF